MIDGLNEGTGDSTLDTAAAAITGLLSATEEKPEREAPRQKPAPAEEAEEQAEATTDEEESEQSSEVDSEVDDEEQETAKPEPRKLRVKVNGEEQELPEDEVVKGYSRQADYTRKTQELSKEREAFKAEADAVRAERQKYLTSITQLEEILKSAAPDEPDWDTLKQGDPAVFAATYAAWDQHQKRIQAVTAEKQRAQEKVRADQSKQLQDVLKSEAAKLLEALPSWKDPEVVKREKAEIIEYAESQGYPAEEVAQITDHRVFKILRDAAMFRKAEKQRPAIEQKIDKVTVVAPGPGENARRPVTELTRRKMALAKTGSVQDAGAVIQMLLDQK
jgi:hypothetical protein